MRRRQRQKKTEDAGHFVVSLLARRLLPNLRGEILPPNFQGTAVSPDAMDLAVSACLAQCVAAEFPLACIADFVDELRRQGWTDDAVGDFQRRIVDGLSRAQDPPHPAG